MSVLPRGPGGSTFSKRTLSIFGLFRALGGLAWRAPRILGVHLRPMRLRPPLREALWLAVTEVNGCRFCAYIHEGMAGTVGLSQEDIDLLLSSSDPASLAGLTSEEADLVAFAKVWVEAAGRPPTAAREGVAKRRTSQAMADLEALLLTIDFSNRCGNTLDSLLHRVSHPRRLLEPWGALNDLLVGLLVALFGWPAVVLGAVTRWRNRRRARAATIRR